MSMMNDLLKGKITEDQIDDYVEKWHVSDSETCELHEFLGLTREEFFEYVKDTKSIKTIMEKHAEKRINELVELLKKASNAYYYEDTEIMTNAEYDVLYDELLNLESRFKYIRSDSPTQIVAYEVKSKLEKEKHEYKALSLDKTKDRESLMDWLKDKDGILSWKLDGLTLQLTYDSGKLTKAVTRGNGEVGENVTHNAKFFSGIPFRIDFKGHLVVRGEALISYSTFNKINEELSDDEKYKNPRNLASGSVRQLNANESKNRGVEFKAFELVYIDDEKENLKENTNEEKLDILNKLGFDVVEHYIVTKENVVQTIEKMEKTIENNVFPSDGLVLTFNDIEYGRKLGMTGKFPKHSIAFKWADETSETLLREIEWSASRTGLINPVAIFEPVELEGTTVSRASIHNVSVMESLKLGKGDKISVYKANMIIPQIAENLTKSNTETVPEACPVCGGKTEIHESLNKGQVIKTLYCTNSNCPAKNIGKFVHFVERDRMNITGLSEATLEKFISVGFIKELADIYKLSKYKDEIINFDGFGERSYKKLIESIESSRNVKLENLIAALGIANVGRDAGKKISKHLNGNLTLFNEKLETKNFLDVEDIGEISNDAINEWYLIQKEQNKEGKSEYFNLLKEINILEPEEKADKENEEKLKGVTVVITGDLKHFNNRNELVEKIEELGGKVSGSVSKKTTYLINNDITSNSSKNKKAKDLNIPILTEEDFIKLIK